MTKRSFEDFQTFFNATLSVEGIDLQGAMGKTRGWTSLAHVDLILALEEWAEVPIPPDLIGELTSVSSILSFLHDNQVMVA